jgi:hypothetical protein
MPVSGVGAGRVLVWSECSEKRGVHNVHNVHNVHTLGVGLGRTLVGSGRIPYVLLGGKPLKPPVKLFGNAQIHGHTSWYQTGTTLVPTPRQSRPVPPREINDVTEDFTFRRPNSGLMDGRHVA